MVKIEEVAHNRLRFFIAFALIASALWAYSPAYAVPPINTSGFTLE